MLALLLMLLAIFLSLQHMVFDGPIPSFLASPLITNAQTSWYPFMDQLDDAQANWNKTFGAHAQMTGWTYIGRIASESERESIVTALSDPEQTWIAKGDPLKPAEVTVIKLSEALVGAPPDTLTQWTNVVNNSVAVGDHVVHVFWLLLVEMTEFQTITIASDNEIKFDPIFATMPMVTISNIAACVGYEITLKWIWGSTRGKISYEVNAICREGHLFTCVHQCDAWLTLGDAQIQCMVEEIDDCCKLHYGYAWRSPTGSIKITWNAEKVKFEVEVTGLGSSGMGSGSVLDCCPVGGIVVPVDKLGLLTPYIVSAFFVTVATASLVAYKQRHENRKTKSKPS